MENITLNIEELLDPISQNLQDKDILGKMEEGTNSSRSTIKNNDQQKPLEDLEKYINLTSLQNDTNNIDNYTAYTMKGFPSRGH